MCRLIGSGEHEFELFYYMGVAVISNWSSDPGTPKKQIFSNTCSMFHIYDLACICQVVLETKMFESNGANNVYRPGSSGLGSDS